MDILECRKKRGVELKGYRKVKGITQTQLSIISGLTQQTISRIERGVTSWNIDTEIIYLNSLRSL